MTTQLEEAKLDLEFWESEVKRLKEKLEEAKELVEEYQDVIEGLEEEE